MAVMVGQCASSRAERCGAGNILWLHVHQNTGALQEVLFGV